MSKTKKVIIIILIFILIAVEGVVLSAKLNIEKLSDLTLKVMRRLEMCSLSGSMGCKVLKDVG